MWWRYNIWVGISIAAIVVIVSLVFSYGLVKTIDSLINWSDEDDEDE